jgi:Monogalactosyldiacylglycerol (MGDG) synthase
MIDARRLIIHVGRRSQGFFSTSGPSSALRRPTPPELSESEEPVDMTGPRVVIISASVGSGHDGAAAELGRRLGASGVVVERHDFLDLMPPRTGAILRSVYRRQLELAPRSWGWVLAAGRHRSLAGVTALADAATLRCVGTGAAAVLSTYPLASQVLGRLRRRGLLAAPTITYLTDMSVHPLWIADGIGTHLAIHAEPAAQARALGAADVHVVAPVVDPAFTPGPGSDRERWGLPHGAPLALIVAGAWGVGEIEKAACDVAATGLAVPVVACGLNDRLRRRLESADFAVPLGWIDDMPALLRTCQVVVQNAGGLSSLEALHAGIPVLTYRSLPGHGRSNAEALERAGWAPWLRTVDELARGLRKALSAHRRSPDLTAPAPEDLVAGRLLVTT